MDQPLIKNNDKSHKYRPEIDGLRAISIIFVLFYHADIQIFSGGYIGVDIFFVISGYLITGILYNNLQNGKFSILDFYDRRLRRILPPLYFMLLIVTIISYMFLLPHEFRYYGRSLANVALFVANIFFYKNTGYFDTLAPDTQLLHAWSLSVEEQFYIFLPLFLAIAFKKFRKYLIISILGLFFISFIASVLTIKINQQADFYLLQYRAWELLAGSLLATWPKLRERQWSALTANCLSGIGLVLVTAPVFVYSNQTLFPGLSAAPVIIGSVILIQLGQNGFTGKFLATSFFVAIGKISYPLYLWHWSLLSLLRLYKMRPLKTNEIILWLLVSLLMSIFSFYVIERPIRSKQIFKTRQAIFSFSIIFILIFGISGKIIKTKNGMPARFPTQITEHLILMSPFNDEFPKCKGKEEDEFLNCYPGQLGFKDSDAPSFILWGDSHAASWAPGLDEIAQKFGVSGLQFTKPSCPPFLGYEFMAVKESERKACTQFNNEVFQFLTESDIKNVIISVRLPAYFRGTGEMPKVEDYKAINSDDNEIFLNIYNALNETVTILEDLGKTVWFVQVVPEHFISALNIWARSKIVNADFQTIGVKSSVFIENDKQFHALVNKLQIDHNNIKILYLNPLICNEKVCFTGDDNGPYYFDSDHLSFLGARFLQDTFAPLMEKIKK
jgi:peptidoglycan/LPS O-acetylase OafA/YrhL